MGRKKSNARTLPQGRRIHVNKYINERGRTKRAAAHRIEKQQECIPMDTTVKQVNTTPVVSHREGMPKQNEIWFAELGNHYGTSVQSGNRPVLILTNDAANRYSKTFTVIPLTSRMKRLELPTHIVLKETDCEMFKCERLEDSVLLIEQITTIDRSALRGRLCRIISSEKKQEIERAVIRQFDMRSMKAADDHNESHDNNGDNTNSNSHNSRKEA